MAVECTGRNVEVTSSLKELAEERTQRLERHLGGPADVRVVLSHEKHRFGAEIIAIHRTAPVEGPGRDGGSAGGGGGGLREDRRAGHAGHSEKRRDKKHRASTRSLHEGAAPADSSRPPRLRRRPGERHRAAIVRSRPPAVKPMGVDEAALAMESTRRGSPRVPRRRRTTAFPCSTGAATATWA